MTGTETPTRKRRTALLAAGALLAGALGTGGMLQGTAVAAPACLVDYKISNDWGSGFSASVTVTNNAASTLSNWKVEWEFSGAQKVGQGWNATVAQSGTRVTATAPSWNSTLSAGGSASFGFNASYSGTNSVPSAFTLNGVTCNVDSGGEDPGDPSGDRVDNPYQGAQVYVNPDWSAQARESGGAAIANQPTAVWLDRRAAITSGSAGENSMGLRDHLDAALEQGADLVQIVTYNLPGRDCAALASNGELGPNDIDIYKREFIDPIAEIVGDPKYADLRIVNIVEIDSLPNLVTNVGSRATATPECDEMLANGNYVKGVGYNLATLGQFDNVYNYIDIGHHGWLGWDDNFSAAAQMLYKAATAEGATVNDVAGFAANVANYGALKEPYFTINDSVNGTSVRQSKWVDWNRYVDELSYAQAFRQEAIKAGFRSDVGVIIDTSRNGWGGPNRPTGAGPKTSVDAYVEGGRIDRRIHTGNWCNQAGAGLGERPKAAPATGIDAYAWIKPPGESDGASREIPNDEGKGFDRMCDPTYEGNPRNNNNKSGALPDAPLSGHWFQAQFEELLRNAYPPVN
ncbi:MAG TPA: glycoside hydrolase family 6 protein [Streptomyces sp.]|uniref:glycoside hydrolase family 6 protein n=1 Tax=Streptomyces sp. TaxID=1931 RepID=UPI002D233E1C|nr:glycoside hydrolase family 6 protein [Streptomyces sp.]HZG04822.1 glycoside hydrolase family 6 protein [Streptomyces sp.]